VSRLPVRLRLTLTFSAVLVGGLAIAGFLFYLRFESVLDSQIDAALLTRANVLAGALRGAPRADWDEVLHGDVGFAQVLAPDGRILAGSPQLRTRRLVTPARLARAGRGTEYFELGRLPGIESSSSRLVARPVGGPNGAVIVAGTPLRSRESANESLAAALLVGGPIALLLAAGAGYGLAAAALRPVESMRRRAARISAAQPGDRLPLPPARDEIRRLGVTLNEMLDRLEAGIERERAFVADASHELRTPLSTLTSELELALRRERSEEELRTAIRSARAQSERLRRLAEDLLVIARADQGGLGTMAEPVPLVPLVEAVADRFASTAGERGRSVVVGEVADAVVEGDALRLEQALGNLVDNALVHGDGDIRVSAVPVGDRVELRVTDAGPGVDPGFRAAAFDRFSRAPEARIRNGAGLGLSIVASVAVAHGGRAELRSAAGGGTEAVITLPIAPTTDMADADLASFPHAHR
jgi:two-component system OmpR family sensor kinase